MPFSRARPERRANLTVITGAQVTRILLTQGHRRPRRRGRRVPNREDGDHRSVLSARKEVILSAGAVGSPQILLLSGIGPKSELEAVGVACRLDSPHVGKHLKDHLYLGLVFPAPGVGDLDDRDRSSRWVPTPDASA